MSQIKTNYPLPERLYYTLEQAAKELGCDADYILHLGASGFIELFIALDSSYAVIENYYVEVNKEVIDVISIRRYVGVFIPIDTMDIYDIEIKKSKFIRLSAKNIYFANHEDGWVELERRDEDSNFHVIHKENIISGRRIYCNDQGVCSFDSNQESYPRCFEVEYDELEAAIIRKSVSSELLILSINELIRLKTGAQPSEEQATRMTANMPKPQKPQHKNTELNAQKREKILKVAIACKKEWPDECKKPSQWAASICEKWMLFHPQEMDPPCTAETISGYLSDAEKLPK